MSRDTEREGQVIRNQLGQPPGHNLDSNQLDASDKSIDTIQGKSPERDQDNSKTLQAVIGVDVENGQVSDTCDRGDDGLNNNDGVNDSLHENGDVHQVSDPNHRLDHDVDETSTNDIERIDENAPEQSDQDEDPTVDQDHESSSAVTTHPSMTPQETKWWAMSFEELYQHARRKKFGKSGKESRKSGRVRIIKWLCKKEGIKPYVAPSITSPAETTPIIACPNMRPTGAMSHPEAILRTSDPDLQRLIDHAEKTYQKWSAPNLLALAMQRSYQLLKDSKGKLPSKSHGALAKWLAAWDILKSPREKKWWLGDGIDLVNRAKAMGYQGSSKKYDVIVWLRTTPEDCEVEVAEIAVPTPNKKIVVSVPEKSLKRRRAEEGVGRAVSKRPAKGSKRPNGWDGMR